MPEEIIIQTYYLTSTLDCGGSNSFHQIPHRTMRGDGLPCLYLRFTYVCKVSCVCHTAIMALSNNIRMLRIHRNESHVRSLPVSYENIA